MHIKHNHTKESVKKEPKSRFLVILSSLVALVRLILQILTEENDHQLLIATRVVGTLLIYA